jgi:hypothetical protein
MTDKDDEPIRRGDAMKAALEVMNWHRGESDIDFGAYAACGDVHQAIAALPAVQPVVTVKPLVWDDFEGRAAKAQAWKRANYLITWWKSRGQFEVVASYPGYQGEAIGAGFYPTIEAAKAAAQADYAARILAALDVQPAPVDPKVAALVDAAKGVKAIIEGIQGAMEHGTWRDDRGNRLKDTAQWVAFYIALAALEGRGND